MTFYRNEIPTHFIREIKKKRKLMRLPRKKKKWLVLLSCYLSVSQMLTVMTTLWKYRCDLIICMKYI